MRLLLIGLALCCFVVQETKAQYSGKLLYGMLLEEVRLNRGKDNIDKLMVGVGVGYVGGVVEALEALKVICLPEEVTVNQVRDVVLQYLKRNRSELNERAISIIEVALAERGWLC